MYLKSVCVCVSLSSDFEDFRGIGEFRVRSFGV